MHTHVQTPQNKWMKELFTFAFSFPLFLTLLATHTHTQEGRLDPVFFSGAEPAAVMRYSETPTVMF